ncbi:leucine-rich repeat domain-containing protein [Chamaesiphon sp.]|uniref:leucine-rich repeat domain-containing protein n=1 Tax=Chamaesiphon sp. TaxID=2814140 RepID=UPI0035930D3D
MSAKTAALAQLIENMTPNSTVLDLRGYGLETLPEDIGTLTYLTKLNLNGNRLTSLPESIGNLTNLTELYLNGHKLTTLPESIGNLTNLTRLDLNGDRLESLPDSIANLTKLTELNLNGNRFDRILDVLLNLPYLQAINLSGNPLTNLANLKNIHNFKIFRSQIYSKFKFVKHKSSIKLITGEQYLEQILLCLSEFKNLVSLSINRLKINDYVINTLTDVSDCQVFKEKAIERILSDLSKLPKLIAFNWQVAGVHFKRFIYISTTGDTGSFSCLILWCKIKSLPECLTNFTELNSININGNPLNDLSILTRLPKLKYVSFMGGHLHRRYWDKFTKWQLEWLLDENNIYIRNAIAEHVKLDIDELIELAIANHHSTVILSNLNLVELPVSIGSISGLTKLILRNNQLTSLPASIGNLTNLIEIDLRNNKLDSLPDSIGNLINLETLDLAVNQFTSLPYCIENLSNVSKIYLYGNNLSDLSILNKLPNLKDFYFFGVNLPCRYWTKFSEWKHEWLLDETNAKIRQVLIDRVGNEEI